VKKPKSAADAEKKQKNPASLGFCPLIMGDIAPNKKKGRD
jgi:hypothetical protein